MAVWSRYSREWLDLGKWRTRRRTRSASVTTMLVTLAYLAVLVSCVHTHPDGQYLGSPVQTFAAKATSETPDSDTDEELCKVVHNQIIAQSFSIGPMLDVSYPYLNIAIHEASSGLTAMLNGFRPPGDRSASAKAINSQLSPVLRI